MSTATRLTLGGVVVAILAALTLLNQRVPKAMTGTAQPGQVPPEAAARSGAPLRESPAVVAPREASSERIEAAPNGGPAGAPGALVIEHTDGRESHDARGRLAIRSAAIAEPINYAEPTSATWIDVVGGRFELDLRPGESFRVAAIEVDGVTETILPLTQAASELENHQPRRTYVVPPDGSALVVRGFVTPLLRLHVLDAETLAPLEDILVVQPDDWNGEKSPPLHPGLWFEEDVVVRDQTSPLDLEPWRDRGDALHWQAGYCVHAPGHAWGWIEVDHRVGGDRQLLLTPGAGDLHIRLENTEVFQRTAEDPSLTGQLLLRVQPVDEARWFAVELDPLERDQPVGVPFGVEGLPADDYVVSVGVGRQELELSLGSTPTTVTPGTRTSVLLALSSAPVAQLVPLAGTLTLDPSWAAHGFEPSLALRRVKGDGTWAQGRPVQRIEELRPGVHRFDAGSVEPGRYEFTSHRREFWYVDVGPAGRTDVTLVLGAPSELVVRLVDERTGEPVAGAPIDCRVPRAQGARAIVATVEEPPGVHHLVMPAGELRISVHDSRYLPLDETVEAHEGKHELTFRLRPTCRLAVTLWDGETQLEVESHGRQNARAGAERMEGDLELHVVGDEGSLYLTTWEDGAVRFSLAPGNYELAVPKLEGYRALDPIPVEVWQEDPVDLRLELERE